MTDPYDLSDLLLDLNHLDDLIRKAAYASLVALGPEAVPHLVADFDRIGGVARLSVIRALGEIADPRAVPLLLELMVDDSPDELLFVTSLAARALGQIADPTAVAGLVALLDHKRTGPRRMAVTVLGTIGERDQQAALPAVPGLIGALRDSDPRISSLAARSLEQIGTPQAIAALAVWREQAG